MKAYYPINLQEWRGSEECCVISEKGSTEFSITCMTGHTRLQKARRMQKCTCLTLKSHDVTPVILLLKRGKENGGHIMIQNIKMAAILLYKTMKGGKKPINNPLLKLAMLVYQKKIQRRFRPMLGNPEYFCFESRSWALESGLQFKESGIPPVIGIWNPSSSDRESEIQLNTFLMQKLSLFHELCLAADHVDENDCLSLLHV